jgi:cytochrome c2
MRYWILGLMLISIFGATSALAQSSDARRGAGVARDLCSSCHAVGKDERQSPVSSAAPFAMIAAVPGMTSAALHAFMQTSHPTMPNVILQPDDRRDIIAYLLSLKSN